MSVIAQPQATLRSPAVMKIKSFGLKYIIMTTNKFLIDPPEGWKFGFPKIFIGDVKTLNILEWVVEQGYPKSLAQSYMSENVFNVRILECAED